MASFYLSSPSVLYWCWVFIEGEERGQATGVFVNIHQTSNILIIHPAIKSKL